jgi:hypothetical protein
MTVQVPHPVLLGLIADGDCPVATCDWARKFRVTLRNALCEAGACQEVPTSITDAEGGERWDHKGYIKMLRETIAWTYEICQLEAEVEEGAYMVTNSPCPCRPNQSSCCSRPYSYYL